MKDQNKLKLQLISDNEQDRAHMEAWWREASDEDKIDVWTAIQQDYDDPVMEIVSRFAQVAFAELATRLS